MRSDLIGCVVADGDLVERAAGETYGRGAEAGMIDIHTVRKTNSSVPALVRY